MNKLEVNIKPLHPDLGSIVPYPTKMTEHASGFDLAAALYSPVELLPGEWKLIPCGFAMSFSPGYEAQIRPRSGMSWYWGITVLNAPGTIDADYRGEVKALVINMGEGVFEIVPGMRIAQMVFAPVISPEIEFVEELGQTSRGDGGFGSTGVGR